MYHEDWHNLKFRETLHVTNGSALNCSTGKFITDHSNTRTHKTISPLQHTNVCARGLNTAILSEIMIIIMPFLDQNINRFLFLD